MKEFKAHISQRILVNLQNAHFGKITLIVLIQLQTWAGTGYSVYLMCVMCVGLPTCIYPTLTALPLITKGPDFPQRTDWGDDLLIGGLHGI